MAVLLAASDCFSADITTLDGKTYKDATVIGVEADGLHIRFRQGVVTVSFRQLPQEIQRQYGYDPAKVVEFRSAIASNRAGAVQPVGVDNLDLGPIMVLVGVLLLVVGCGGIAIYTNAKSRAAKKPLMKSSQMNWTIMCKPPSKRISCRRSQPKCF
jgi:hypothetical protein